MYCSLTKDQPHRVRLTKSGVVHAAAYRDYGGFTRYHYREPDGRQQEFVPKQKRLEIACRWRQPKKELDKYVVSNKENITCKACMKRMGMAEGPISPKRYVVRKIDTGEFMKNTNSRCSGWSESLSDAFFFRTEHTARQKCRVWRYHVGGEPISRSEISKRKLTRSDYKMVEMDDPNYEVKPVKFALED